MARKPNYSFEKRERERQKAAKKAARLAAKAEKAEARRIDPEGDEPAEATNPSDEPAPEEQT